MRKRKPSPGPIPPTFVMDEYLRRLRPSLSMPLQVLFSLRTCIQRVNADLSTWLGADALSPGRMQMMIVLWARSEPMQQSELVRSLEVSRASASELIDTMTREGLVSSEPDPNHGRRHLVGLTDQGRQLAQSQLTTNASRLGQSFGALSDEEQRMLVALLDRLCGKVAQ